MYEKQVQAARVIANAITADAAPGHDAAGGTVNSLTEAVMGMTAALTMIAQAMERIADALEGAKNGQ